MGSKVPAEARSTNRPGSLLDKYFHLFLSGTILLALLLRIAALLSLKESIYFDFLLWDEGSITPGREKSPMEPFKLLLSTNWKMKASISKITQDSDAWHRRHRSIQLLPNSFQPFG